MAEVGWVRHRESRSLAHSAPSFSLPTPPCARVSPLVSSPMLFYSVVLWRDGEKGSLIMPRVFFLIQIDLGNACFVLFVCLSCGIVVVVSLPRNDDDN